MAIVVKRCLLSEFIITLKLVLIEKTHCASNFTSAIKVKNVIKSWKVYKLRRNSIVTEINSIVFFS